MSVFKQILKIILSLTWGLPQSLIGFFVLLFNLKSEIKLIKGSIVIYWKYYSGVSLGLFIFSPKVNKEKIYLYDSILTHELGHTIQSLILGPFYLLIIGLPSLLWAGIFHDLTKKDYYWLYTEKWAERLANRYFRT